MDTDVQKYIDRAVEEILNPQFATTKQYLEVNEIKCENGKPKVERIDFNYSDELVAIYFPFKNEHYFLQINLKKVPEPYVSFVFTENGNKTYFTAVSEDLNFEELSQGLLFKPLTGYSKGDYQKNGRAKYKFSRLMFEPFTSEAYDLENQIDLLLTELEKTPETIKQLAEKSTAYISVRKYQYVSGNAGVHFDIKTIKRLSDLNLSVDIDTYIVGKPLKYEDE